MEKGKSSIVSFVILAVTAAALPFSFARAQIETPTLVLCDTLSQIGLFCLSGNNHQTIKNNSLVQAEGSSSVYQIVKAKKHLIPSQEIFNDYGFDKNKIITVAQTQLDQFPRVKLVRSKSDRDKIYYLTENGFKRFVPDTDVLDSYGDKKSDIVAVSDKELAYYPDNQYIYISSPHNPDVFKIDGKYKYYLTPMAVQRLGIRQFEVAPVNKFEFDYYKYGRPVIE